MNENPQCRLCALHSSAHLKSVCLKGGGGGTAPLVVFLDSPTLVEDSRHRGFVSDGAELVRWMFRRMSLKNSDVYVDYVLKCYTGKDKTIGRKAYRQEMIEACSVYRFATLQTIKPKAIVAMGSKACEAFIGSEKVGNYEGTHWIPTEPAVREYVPHIWVTYSPFYALEKPAESVTIYRTLFRAAEDAGLQPTLDENVTPFDYGK